MTALSWWVRLAVGKTGNHKLEQSNLDPEVNTETESGNGT